MYLIFDTETTGLPKDFNAPIANLDNWPRCIQIAWQLHDEMGNLIEAKDYLVKPDGFKIPLNAEQIHGISTDLAIEQGVDLNFVLEEFNTVLGKSKFIVGQNVGFDVNVMGAEFLRQGIPASDIHQKAGEYLDYKKQNPKGKDLVNQFILDTCIEKTAELCQIPGGRGGKFKLPTLTELHKHLFGEGFGEAHNATADVEATTRCFLELIRSTDTYTEEDLGQDPGYLTRYRQTNTQPFTFIGLTHLNLKEESKKIADRKRQESGPGQTVDVQANLNLLRTAQFSHLHNHSQYSILQATSQIGDLVSAAAKDKMPAVALTDTGNMMAAYHFTMAVDKHNKSIEAARKEAEEKGEPFDQQILKSIVGCEFNVCADHKDKSRKDNGYQVPLLAKNKNGYHNIAKLSSQAFIDGFYYVPRIDRDLIIQHKEDVIALTGSNFGEIPYLILNVGEEQAEEAFKWWHEQFGDDFYAEIIRHGLEEEDHVNEILLGFCKKYGVKYVASNNTYYISKSDAEAHDILICVKDGQKKDTPVGKGRGFRYGFPNDQYYFKSQDEMKEAFKDLPEAIITVQEIVDKCENYILARDVLLPAFDIPEEFIHEEDKVDGGKRGENAFLRHLTYVGAEKRYDEITDEIRERLDFELATIERTGYPGYFLIVQDFTTAAREMGVSVGPGRGSAAGSAVAYCVGITNVDPIKYDLLFERFLNPDRVSLPDIDIDFDDEGRGRVIDYVINKYGASQVAQIITYGTMAAKSSIRDTGRVLDLPLPDTDQIAKLVPDTKLNKLFKMNDEVMAEKLSPEQIEMARELFRIKGLDDLKGEVLRTATSLEGSVRNTGIHACGVIITPSDIRQHVPVAVAKDSDMWCTQFDNSVVEDAGLLKMDFLGLKTLTLIKDAVAIVKQRHGIEIDPDEIPLDDVGTYELFQRGETVGVFQYESTGMQKYLKELKPSVFGDLIAMNALYRPGPLEYIPSFVKRKHGQESITYDLDGMEEYLQETYGITVYQEQVMLLSQKLAGFTKGEADMLRKAMGKKIFALLEKMKPKFIKGGIERGHKEKILEKVWKDWEAFAAYAFNKSHSTCYAWVAFQTAYLKAHYPAEYMASVLSNNMNDIKTITFFMEECKRMGVPVLGPDVNESVYKFTVNDKGEIRFGLGAIKGVGGGAVEAIVSEREENGPYKDIFDLTKRLNLKAANKKCLENLALAGGFDNFPGIHRAQFFYQKDERDSWFLEKAIRFGLQFQSDKDSSQHSLFGESSEVELPQPPMPVCREWTSIEKLSKERDVVGIFISGHPLDDYKIEMDYFCNTNVGDLENLEQLAGKECTMAVIVTEAAERLTKKGNQFGILTVEDYYGSHTFYLFGEDYLKLRIFMVEGSFLHVHGRIQKRKFGDDLEFKISNLSLLSEVREKQAKSITLNLDVNFINEEKVEQLHNLISTHKGNCELKLGVYDIEEKIKIELASRKFHVNPSNEFFQDLENLSVTSYNLN